MSTETRKRVYPEHFGEETRRLLTILRQIDTWRRNFITEAANGHKHARWVSRELHRLIQVDDSPEFQRDQSPNKYLVQAQAWATKRVYLDEIDCNVDDVVELAAEVLDKVNKSFDLGDGRSGLRVADFEDFFNLRDAMLFLAEVKLNQRSSVGEDVRRELQAIRDLRTTMLNADVDPPEVPAQERSVTWQHNELVRHLERVVGLSTSSVIQPKQRLPKPKSKPRTMNEDRDKKMYNLAKKMELTYKEIGTKLNDIRIEKKCQWTVPKTIQGIRTAIRTYAEKHGLEMPPERQSK